MQNQLLLKAMKRWGNLNIKFRKLNEQEQQKLKNMSIRVVVYKNLNEEMKRYCYERSNDTF